jgi:hypothetical protein
MMPAAGGARGARELQVITDSTSWRLTALLRRFARFQRSLTDRAEAAPPVPDEHPDAVLGRRLEH